MLWLLFLTDAAVLQLVLLSLYFLVSYSSADFQLQNKKL